MTSPKQLLFGPRTVNALGLLLLAGLSCYVAAWWLDWPTGRTLGFWLAAPFLLLLALLLLVVAPWTWLTSRRR